MSAFEGVLLGSGSFHAREAIAMHGLEVIYVEMNGQPEFYEYEPDSVCAELFYDSDLGMYGVQPHERLAVFLLSGQPLGKNRRYYLPRGTEIYFKERENAITLG